MAIVSLEFSYTQAPKSMKSLIMSLWLGAVFLGNFVTAGINGFIQVDDPVAKIEAADAETVHGGHDGVVGTDDDILLVFDAGGRRTDLRFGGREAFDRLLAEVEARIAADGFEAPSNADGAALAAAATDPWGNPYQYRLLNRNRIRVWSAGPDKTPTTPWDQGAVLTIHRPEETEPGALAKVLEPFHPERTWLDRRREALGLPTEADAAASEPTLSRDYFVGGQVKLEGAAYFWFFSGLMLAAALLFLVVAKLYKPREYFHDEEDDDDDEEAAAA